MSTDHDYNAATQHPTDQLAAAQDKIAQLHEEVESLQQEKRFVTCLSKDSTQASHHT